MAHAGADVIWAPSHSCHSSHSVADGLIRKDTGNGVTGQVQLIMMGLIPSDFHLLRKMEVESFRES